MMHRNFKKYKDTFVHWNIEVRYVCQEYQHKDERKNQIYRDKYSQNSRKRTLQGNAEGESK